ncbi:hypothetical protein ACODUL_05900 [Stenotrophomonas maltophilia]
MFNFITLFLPAEVSSRKAAPVLQRNGRLLRPHDSPSLQEAVGPDWRPWLTSDTCEPMDGLASAQAIAACSSVSDGSRWRRRGYSEEQIAQMLVQEREFVQRQQERRLLSAQEDGREWLRIADGLAALGVDRIGLLLLGYYSTIALSVPHPAPPQQQWRRSVLQAADLVAFDQGTLNWLDLS